MEGLGESGETGGPFPRSNRTIFGWDADAGGGGPAEMGVAGGVRADLSGWLVKPTPGGTLRLGGWPEVVAK